MHRWNGNGNFFVRCEVPTVMLLLKTQSSGMWHCVKRTKATCWKKWEQARKMCVTDWLGSGGTVDWKEHWWSGREVVTHTRTQVVRREVFTGTPMLKVWWQTGWWGQVFITVVKFWDCIASTGVQNATWWIHTGKGKVKAKLKQNKTKNL